MSQVLRLLRERLLCSAPLAGNGWLYKPCLVCAMARTARGISPMFWPYGPHLMMWIEWVQGWLRLAPPFMRDILRLRRPHGVRH